MAPLDGGTEHRHGVEAVNDEVAPLLEFCCHFVGVVVGLLHGFEHGVLHGVVGTSRDIILNFDNLLHGFKVGGNDVADAPASHSEGLGKGIDNHQLVVARAHEGDMVLLKHDAVVDFVGNNPKVVFLRKVQKVIALLFVEGAARWIAWEVVENGHRVLVHQGFQILNLRNEFMFKQARVVLAFATHQGRIGTVEREVGFGRSTFSPGLMMVMKRLSSALVPDIVMQTLFSSMPVW